MRPAHVWLILTLLGLIGLLWLLLAPQPPPGAAPGVSARTPRMPMAHKRAMPFDLKDPARPPPAPHRPDTAQAIVTPRDPETLPQPE